MRYYDDGLDYSNPADREEMLKERKERNGKEKKILKCSK